MHHHTAPSDPICYLPIPSPSTNEQAKPSISEFKPLRDALKEVLPTGFNCKTRYVQSPPKPCEPLFSAMPGQDSEKTRLASHFLIVSVDAASLPQSGSGDVMSFAIEILAYTTRKLTTLFVSKVDSTSYIPRIRPSPIKSTVTAFLKWLIEKERRKRPSRKIVISLFARAQSQYLFPGSADDNGKHVLDDRQLIKWWARVLDPIIPKATTEQSHEEAELQYQAYMTVPGYAKTELRSFMPPNGGSGDSPRWLPGHPLIQLAHTRGIPEHAPARCLLPRFPDDPKARFISDLDEEIGISQDAEVTVSPSKRKSGKWKSVMNLDQFWEQMEFRQECSSGRVVGFLWLVISPKTDEGDSSQSTRTGLTNLDSQESTLSIPALSSDSVLPDEDAAAKSSPTKKKRARLTGPIIPRMPKVKSTLSNLPDMLGQLDADSEGIVVTQDGYDRAMSFLLQLDFSNLQIATKSTTKWVAELLGSAGLNADFAVDVAGMATAESAVANTTNGASVVNDLGGMIKKRKAPDTTGSTVDSKQEVAGSEQATVNVLASGMIRKKPRPAAK